MKYSHLTKDERKSINFFLNQGLSFKEIARQINKDCTTVSKEIRLNSIEKKISYIGRAFNNCVNRLTCKYANEACQICTSKPGRLCTFCGKCIKECPEYFEEICPLLRKPPYVCNACQKRNRCSLTKRLYDSLEATRIYQERLSSSRTGFIINETEIARLEEILRPLIEKNQSIHHIFITHKDEIMLSEKTIYNLIDSGVFSIRNIDLPRKVKYRVNRKKKTYYKVDKKCRIGRTYIDYQNFIKEHPDMATVQMDTVEGIKGESCLLTLHFVVSSFMIAIKRFHNDSKSVIDYFNYLYDSLGHVTFTKLFPVILTDNGSEFSNPEAIEFNSSGERRTYIFYCDPSSPFEKGSCEVNHELIRRIVYKGTSFDQYTQELINLMMSNINSYPRARLNDNNPYKVFEALFGKEILDFLNISFVEPDDIQLNKKLISE